ncbi:hypothetical protein DSL72_001043 [Monilinia vaccinii-corymbosi]|uniref:Uncharacterized protein n=1 Tax=Monilinia vaccinii-corymbosi TaxID=61207 RepID=A0A8A3P8Z8_9HELO|nr:hypothetical protein DSL72_001043 [Monilinia vaccinii-corymbosi]
MSSESKAFLPDQERSDNEVLTHRTDDSRISWRVIFWHAALIAAYTIVFIFAWRRSALDISTAVHPIPGVSIQYVPVTPPDLPSSPYAGPPSDSVDRAWHDLLKNMNIRVTAEELEKRKQKSIALPEGGGHMVWIGAHHQLHCIASSAPTMNFLPQAANRTTEDAPTLELSRPLLPQYHRSHNRTLGCPCRYCSYCSPILCRSCVVLTQPPDHCFDVLRSAVMCQGDTTLTTFGWDKLSKPQPHVKATEHRCVDWDALMESLADRVVSEEEMAALVNPRLAPDA